MGDVLVHHGILGQKWGVRRFQNKDGSLTKAGRERYDVGNAKDGTTSVSSGLYESSKQAIKQYKEKYENALKRLNSIDQKSITGNKYKGEHNRSDEYKKLISDYYENIFRPYGINNHAEYENTKPPIDRFNEAAKLVGLKELTMNEYIRLGIGLSVDASDKTYETAMKYIAAYQAYVEMNNLQNLLPSEVEEEDELREKTKKMYTELEKYGLSGIFTIDRVWSERGITKLVYTSNTGAEFSNINDARKYALENDLFFKDFRSTQNVKTREKNVDASKKATVKKGKKIDVSEKEREEKEGSSRKTLEGYSTQLQNIWKGRKRTEAAMKQTKAVKEAEKKKEAQKLEQRLKKQENIANSISAKIQNLFQSNLTKKQISSINSNKYIKDAYTKVWDIIWGSSVAKKKKFEHSDQSSQDILVHYGTLNLKWGYSTFESD